MFFRESSPSVILENDQIYRSNSIIKNFYGKNILIWKGSFFPDSSEQRYYSRIEKWMIFIFIKYENRNIKINILTAKLYHHFWWLIHNVIAHPFLTFKSMKSLKFHNFTSEKLNLEFQIGIYIPDSMNKVWWIIHNLLIHPLIGIIPCKLTFKWHDQSAKLMKAPGWV